MIPTILSCRSDGGPGRGRGRTGLTAGPCRAGVARRQPSGPATPRAGRKGL